VIPETDEEKALYDTAPGRAELRKLHRGESKKLAEHLKVDKFWDMD
jgi:hypothetical protein